MDPKDLGSLIKINPGRARTKLLSVFEVHGGMTTRVADAMGVSHSTVKRWVARLKLRSAIDAIRERHGKAPSLSWGTTAAGRRGSK